MRVDHSVYFSLVTDSCEESIEVFSDKQSINLLDLSKDEVTLTTGKRLLRKDTMHFMLPAMTNESIAQFKLFVDSNMAGVFETSGQAPVVHFFEPMGSIRVDLPKTETWTLLDENGLPVAQGRGSGVNHWLILDNICAFMALNDYITRNLFKQTIINLNKR